MAVAGLQLWRGPVARKVDASGGLPVDRARGCALGQRRPPSDLSGLAGVASAESAPVDALLHELEGNPDQDEAYGRLQGFVGGLRDPEFEGVLDALGDRTTWAAGEIRRAVVRRWAEKAPQAAAAWASDLPEGVAHRDALAQVAVAWAGADPSSGWAWLTSLPVGPDEQSAALQFAYEVSRTSPTEALAIAAELGPSSERDEFLAYAAGQWAGADADSAVAWARSVADAVLRQQVLAGVSVAVAAQNPVGAATLAATLLEPGEQQQRAVVSIVQRWAQHSAAEAAAWVQGFQDGPARAAAVKELVAIRAAQGGGE
jgi:hypothetical protein